MKYMWTQSCKEESRITEYDLKLLLG